MPFDFTYFNRLEVWIGVLVILLLVILSVFIIKKSKKPKKKPLDVERMLLAFGENNILDLQFKRHKINVTVKEITQTDTGRLKEEGATGINIVGDTIKFYVEDRTEMIYQAMQEAIERKK